MDIILTVLLVVLLVIAGVVAGGVALARSSRDKYHSANEVVPGTPTRAPKEWAGAHTAEARLHRRLRDAVAALRANPALDDLAFHEARMMVEQEALAVDDRLVAVAALPPQRRNERLQPVAEAVEAIESVVAEMVDVSTATADTSAALDAVRTRLELVAQARAELAGIESGARMDELRQGLEAEDETEVDSTDGQQPPETPAS